MSNENTHQQILPPHILSYNRTMSYLFEAAPLAVASRIQFHFVEPTHQSLCQINVCICSNATANNFPQIVHRLLVSSSVVCLVSHIVHRPRTQFLRKRLASRMQVFTTVWLATRLPCAAAAWQLQSIRHLIVCSVPRPFDGFIFAATCRGS